MTRKLRLSPYPTAGSITIANGKVHPIHRGGNFIRVRAADQEFTIRIDNETELKGMSLNDIIELEKGDTFEKIEVVNNSGSNLTFQLDIGYGRITTNSVSINGTLATMEQGGAALTTTADDSVAATTTEQVLAANTDRKHAVISNLQANTAVIRVGDSNTGAARGTEIAPGGAITIESTAAIFVYNSHSSAQSVGILEVEKT